MNSIKVPGAEHS